MSKPSKNMPMPISIMMRRWNGPIGSRSRRLPALTDVTMCVLPSVIVLSVAAAAGRSLGPVQPPAICFKSLASVQAALARRVAVPVERLVMGRDHHALGVEVVVEAFGPELAADAGIIDAAPGRSRIEPVMVVDPDDAGLDGGRHPMRAPDVAGPDRGGEAERRVVSKTQ